MASVFKRGRKWYARYRNADGNLKKEVGFTDKTETMRLAVKLEHEADLVRCGLAEAPKPKVELSITDCIKAFRSSLSDSDVSDEQVCLVVGRCERVISGCGFTELSGINPAAVESWLAKQRKSGGNKAGKKPKVGISIQTSNHYLRAVKQFTRWMLRHKKMRDDPLIYLKMLNVQVDRRHDRRALSDVEVSKVLNATKSGGVAFGFEPIDRYMLYVVALSTGLRASELASLKPESLQLLESPTTVTVKAGYSKHRRQDVLPLPSSIIEELKGWLKSKPAGELLWPGKWAQHRYAGKVLQVDLEAAGVEYKDANGLFADFHALRHTYISNLARHGVPLATAQKLARHSTPVLTATRYTHIDLADQYREVGKLPSLQLGRNLEQIDVISCPKSSSNGNSGTGDSTDEESEKPQKTGVFQAERVRFELTMPLRTCRFSRPVQSATLPPLRASNIDVKSLYESSYGNKAGTGT